MNSTDLWYAVNRVTATERVKRLAANSPYFAQCLAIDLTTAARLPRGLRLSILHRMDFAGFVRSVGLRRDDVESFEHFPYSLAAIRNLDRLEIHPNVTFFTGENGTGKSTLLEALAISLGFNPEGGGRNFKFSTRNSHSDLHARLSVSRGISRPRDGFFFRAESFFNVGTEIELLDSFPAFGPPIISYFGGLSLHEQSHGEAFFSFIKSRLATNGLYLLDEPEAGLSPTRQIGLLARIDQLVRNGCQLIIASHSPVLIWYPKAFVYEFGSDGIRKIEPSCAESYLAMRDFLDDPGRVMHRLLNETATEE